MIKKILVHSSNSSCIACIDKKKVDYIIFNSPFFQYSTLCFFYKNLFYKNVEAEINQNFKNVLRTFLRLRVD